MNLIDEFAGRFLLVIYFFFGLCIAGTMAIHHHVPVGEPEIIVVTLPPAMVTPGNKPDFIREWSCLTRAVYFESRGEGPETKRHIAEFLRQFSIRNTKTICQEIGSHGRYPWYKNRLRVNIKNRIDQEAWDESRQIAYQSLTGEIHIPNFTATHFITPDVIINHYKKPLPAWYDRNRVVKVVGRFHFLKLDDYS